MEEGRQTAVPQAQPPQPDAAPAGQEPPAPAPRPTAREALYSHFDKVPLKAVDTFIVVCVIAFFAVIAFGVAQAHGLV